MGAISKFFGRRSASVTNISIPANETDIQKQIGEYKAVNNTLRDALGCAMPTVDPYALLVLLNANGYHSAAIAIKTITSAGQGYTASDALMAHITDANEDQTFQDFLDEFSFDLETYGNAYVEVKKVANTFAFYRSPALKTRVIPPKTEDDDESYCQYEYLSPAMTMLGRGFIARVIHPKYRKGDDYGMRQFKLLSRAGDRYYGDPDYLSATKLLGLNASIIQVVEKFFENALIGDKAIIIRGGDLDEEAKLKLKNYIASSFKGIDNAHKVALIEVGRDDNVEIIDLNSNLKDSDYSALRDKNRDEIIAADRVAPRLVGIVSAGQLGAIGEVEGQLKIFKLAYVDSRQLKYEGFFRKLFRDLGLPDAETFTMTPLDITAGTTDMATLAQGVAAGILQQQEARDEWMTEKSIKAPDDERIVRTLVKSLKEIKSRLLGSKK